MHGENGAMMPVVQTTILHYAQSRPHLGSILRGALRQLSLPLVLDEIQCSGHRYVVEERVRQCCDFEEVDWLILLGGTWPAPGPSAEETVPWATRSILERELPGIMEALRAAARETWPHAMLDGSVAGIRGMTFVLDLPADEHLLPLYIKTLEPVLASLFQALHSAGALPASGLASLPDTEDAAPDAKGPRSALQADEFAAFLAARRQEAADQE